MTQARRGIARRFLLLDRLDSDDRPGGGDLAAPFSFSSARRWRKEQRVIHAIRRRCSCQVAAA